MITEYLLRCEIGSASSQIPKLLVTLRRSTGVEPRYCATIFRAGVGRFCLYPLILVVLRSYGTIVWIYDISSAIVPRLAVGKHT